MGFFEENADLLSGGGNYVDADEKQVLIENGVPFPITGLRVDDHEKYGERFIATVVIPEGLDDVQEGDRVITFPKGTVESRDRMLDAMLKWLDDPSNEPPVCKLEKVGRSIILRPAE